jgi:hypothetical protein
MPGGLTIEAVFLLDNLWEGIWSTRTCTYMVFINLKKKYDEKPMFCHMASAK